MTDAPPPSLPPEDRVPTPSEPPPPDMFPVEDASFAYPPPPQVDAVFVPYAAWWRRLVASLLDWLIVAVPIAVLASAFDLIQAVRDVDGNLVEVSASNGLSLLAMAITLAYSTLMEGGARGATQMALLIQVRDGNTGGPIGYARALGRRFIFLILFQLLFLPGAINGLSPLWDARRQAWHDKAVGSVVVDAPRP